MNNFILYAVTVLIWGTTFYAIKLQLGVVDPFVSVVYRFALAGGILIAYCAFTGRLKKSITIRQHGFMILLGAFLFSLNYWGTYHGTLYMTSGLVALCFSTITVMNILNQRLFFKIRVTKSVVAGTLIGLTGMVLVFYPEIQNVSTANTALGIGLCLMGAYSASLGNMASIKTTKEGLSITIASAFGMIYGAIIAAIICFALGKDFSFSWDPAYIGSLLYLAVLGSVVAFLCFLTLIKNIGADKAAYATILFPAVALTLSTFLENYHWSALAIAGVILILSGNYIAMRKTPAKKGLTKFRG